jgi:hypothetical protein
VSSEYCGGLFSCPIGHRALSTIRTTPTKLPPTLSGLPPQRLINSGDALCSAFPPSVGPPGNTPIARRAFSLLLPHYNLVAGSGLNPLSWHRPSPFSQHQNG